MLLNKISYRVVFNHNHHLKLNGEAAIEIECRQGLKRIYFPTNFFVMPNQFKHGFVINHPNKDKYNACIIKFKNELENIELEYILKGNYLSLTQLKELFTEKSVPSSTLIEFGKIFIENSDRKNSTKDGYNVFFNNIELFHPGLILSDITYNTICKYEKWLKDCGIAHNTICGRLQQFKTIMTEAYKRNIIKEKPFDNFKMPTMVNKTGFITTEYINKLENLKLRKKEEITRDAFLFSCWTGLRYSDLSSLTQDEIKDGWIIKTMKKTGKTVKIPLNGLFDDKPLKMIEKYNGNIRNLTKKMGQCGTLNQILKKIFKMVGLENEKFTFHTARHTCASLLLMKGVQLTTIQHILGHTKISTSQIYAEVTKETIENDIKKINRKKK